MVFNKPRLMVAALRGGSGKTVVSVGLLAAWRLAGGLRVVPFKKGPDYIDASWLAKAAQRPCYNLDPFLMKPEEILSSFVHHSEAGDGSLVEGNRGLYDGVDVQGSFSTAELAKLLAAPVVLVLDATKVTRTAAALVLGCQQLDPEVNIAGVILNQVAGKRHESVLRGAIERYCGVPVVGVVPKDVQNFFPERHLGLVPPQESCDVAGAMEFAAKRMTECLDLQGIWRIATSSGPLGRLVAAPLPKTAPQMLEPLVIGVIRDSAFQFYYPENLEALQARGAVIVEISSFERRPLPPIDALYMGGGFPETHLEVLAENKIFRQSLNKEIEAGLPVYAECGGLMFLCRSIACHGSTFPVTGVFPYDVVMEKRPQGHGYTVLECVKENPFYAAGECFKGHEFHYSRIVGAEASMPLVFKLKKGHGIVAGWDGMCYKRVLASYSHVHAVGNQRWADAMVGAALEYRREKSGALDRGCDPENRTTEAFKYGQVI
jgi:cobyrinic acid a,c-diamide synthase